jgi:NAD(P)-dependent dehydrogenase (short-subunit alcohol dehydrogenase family)
MGRLDGKCVFITGAASGIGSATALRLAEEGARVAGFDASPAGDERWERAARLAPDAFLLKGDVRDEASVAEAVAAATQRFGGIDTVVSSAGVAGGGPVHLLPVEEWDRVIDVNLKGTFLVCKHVLPGMLERRSGSIINIASIEGLVASEGGSAYNASKAGVVLLTRNMAMDYGRMGIRANAICPGFIETPLFHEVFGMAGLDEYRERIVDASQVGRAGRPEEIANAVLFLASDESSFVTGHALVVDGGFTAGHRVGLTRLMGLE